MAFPTSLDTFSTPTGSDPLSTPSHSGLHNDVSTAVEELEQKIGIGASDAGSAAAGTLLTADGSGGSAWVAPSAAGVQPWASQIIKVATDSVTNNQTLTDDSEMQFAVLAGEIWRWEMDLIYSGDDATADMRAAWVVSGAGVMNGFWRFVGSDAQNDTIASSLANRVSTNAFATIGLGTNASDTPRVGIYEATCRFTGNGTCKFQYAQFTATVGKTVKVRPGTRLLLKKLV